MVPDDNYDCWSNTTEITISELFSIYNPTLAKAERCYVVCPNTEFLIGTQLSQGATFLGGDFPIGVFLPGLHIMCGKSGSSENKCMLSGGQEQITSLVSTDLLEALFPLLPELVPGLAEYPKKLPRGFQLDTSDLIIEGMTFTNFSMFPENKGGDGLLHAPLHLISPGQNMAVQDCIFESGKIKYPAGSAIELNFEKDLWSGKGSYLEVMVKDCVFYDSSLENSIINSLATCMSNVCTPDAVTTLPGNVIDLTVDSCLFEDNMARSAMGLESTKGLIKDSCFVDTTIRKCKDCSTHGRSLFETFDSPNIKFEKVFEKDTNYVDAPKCRDAAAYETETKLGNSIAKLETCIKLDYTKVCGADGRRRGKQGYLGKKKKSSKSKDKSIKSQSKSRKSGNNENNEKKSRNNEDNENNENNEKSQSKSRKSGNNENNEKSQSK
eukprot:scaffold125421_cov58-Attheya_sp.AAC.1